MIAAVVLAAGTSVRFGAPKKCVHYRAAQAVAASGARVVYNSQARDGMGASITWGASALGY